MKQPHPRSPARRAAPQELAHPARFGELPLEHKRAVLLSLWYALNWHRELLSAYGTQLKVTRCACVAGREGVRRAVAGCFGGGRPDNARRRGARCRVADETWALKLFARARGALQLEAVLSSLLPVSVGTGQGW